MHDVTSRMGRVYRSIRVGERSNSRCGDAIFDAADVVVWNVLGIDVAHSSIPSVSDITLDSLPVHPLEVTWCSFTCVSCSLAGGAMCGNVLQDYGQETRESDPPSIHEVLSLKQLSLVFFEEDLCLCVPGVVQSVFFPGRQFEIQRECDTFRIQSQHHA